MQQTDSISQSTATEGIKVHRSQTKKELTAGDVIRRLPADATPEQQDSAVQAFFKPKPIHYSNRPDTLHFPGQPVGKSFRDVSLPQYYKESFFSKDSLFHPELTGGRVGVAGDPVPYTIAGDNIITSILLACFILSMVVFAQTRRFVVRQAKNFFYVPHSENTTTMTETSGEFRFQLFLMLQTCLMFSIFNFFYTQTYITQTFIISQYLVLGLYVAVLVGYMLLKAMLYGFTNWVFFDKRKNEQWMKSFIFIVACEGVAVFPLIMLLAFFNLSIARGMIYVGVVVVLFRLLTLYRLYIIFFRGKGAFLQLILYFCGLEIVPLLTLGGVYTILNNYLEINF